MSRSARPRIVEWYRVDETPRIARVALQGSLLLMAGCLAVGIAVGSLPQGDTVRWLLGIVGGLCTVAGPLWTILGFQRIMNNEIYVAFRNDGVLLHEHGHDELIPWDDLEEATWQAEPGAVLLHRRQRAPVVVTHQFAGMQGPQLARRLNEMRRKALWNLLPGMR